LFLRAISRISTILLDSFVIPFHRKSVFSPLPGVAGERMHGKGRAAEMRRLIDSSARKNRFRAVARVGLSVYLALSLGLFPLLRVAHLVLADHGHRYCDKHQQFEDVPRDSVGVLVGAARGATAHIWSGSKPSPKPQQHLACSLLNSGVSCNGTPLPNQPPAVARPAQIQATACGQQETFVSCPLLLTAPKTSPPFIAA
jgi:hypothetical protein